MHIVVCVKQVLAPESELAPSPAGDRIAAVGAAEYRLNRYDAGALETALRIRESVGETTVEAITVGPPAAGEGLRRAMGMGADRATHILTDEFLWDPAATAKVLAAALADAGPDLILAGAMSEDLMQGIVGPALAAHLDLPCATAVVALETAPDRRRVTVTEEMEHGEHRVVALDLPALVTVQTGIHPPRYPSLSGLLRARRHPVREIAAVGTVGTLRVTGLAPPVRTRQGRVLEGDAAEKARLLAAILQQRGFLAGAVP